MSIYSQLRNHLSSLKVGERGRDVIPRIEFSVCFTVVICSLVSLVVHRGRELTFVEFLKSVHVNKHVLVLN